jgi:hypothetical protein
MMPVQQKNVNMHVTVSPALPATLSTVAAKPTTLFNSASGTSRGYCAIE